MEGLAVVLVPVLILGLGMLLVLGRFPTPGGVTRSLMHTLWALVRWLWKERSPHRGGGRLKRPRLRYRR